MISKFYSDFGLARAYILVGYGIGTALGGLNDYAMKNYPKRMISIVVLAFLFSCQQKGELKMESQADSLAYQTPADAVPTFSWADSLHSRNAVRVELDSSRPFDWGTFRERFHAVGDSSGGFSEEMAVGPWVNWNEYQYRLVYRFANDALWIQTFYRSNDSTESQSSEGVPVMDSQEPGYVQFGPLWSDMLTRGHHLSDSL